MAVMAARSEFLGCEGRNGVRRPNRKRSQERHGQKGTPTYNVWMLMTQRCTNPNNPSWKYYGGRGISVCGEWHLFSQFFLDMGHKPDGMTLDRIDANGNYEKGNCRWATQAVQMGNRPACIYLRINGNVMHLKGWCKHLNLSYNSIQARLRRGFPASQLIAGATLCPYTEKDNQ